MDWTTAPIEPVAQWARHQEARPSFGQLADDLIHQSGFNPALIDRDKVVNGLTNIAKGIATEHLPGDEDAITQIFERPISEKDLFWNFLTHRQATGVALSNHIGKIITGETARDVMFKMIAGGKAARECGYAPDGLPEMFPDSPNVAVLANPQRVEHDSLQLAYGLLDAAGLSLVVYGNGDLNQCFHDLCRVVPNFASPESEGGLIASLPGVNGVFWFGIEGPHSAAIVVAVGPEVDIDAFYDGVVHPVKMLDHPWHTAMARGAKVPMTFADQFERSVVKRIWNISGLERLRPPDADPAELSWQTRQLLIAEGWTWLSNDLFTGKLETGTGTITLGIGSHKSSHSVFALICEAENGQTPIELKSLPVGDFEITVDFDHVLLLKRFDPRRAPTFEEITTEAGRLTETYQRLFGIDTASLPETELSPSSPPPPSVPQEPTRSAPSPAVEGANTTVLSKGANTELTSRKVQVALNWNGTSAAVTLDTSGLLLGSDRRIRTDADFIFYNQPAHPSGAVRYEPATSATGADSLSIDTDLLDSSIEAVAVVASLDSGTFSALTGLKVRLVDVVAGKTILTFTPDDLTSETALIVGEVYRRNGTWRFRAIGQGYDSGLRGVAMDFGISVD